MGSLCSAPEAFRELCCATAHKASPSESTAQLRNAAILFIKPHAVRKEVRALVEKVLLDRSIAVRSSAEISAETIDQKGLIDSHYGAIAARALKQLPKDLVVQAGPKAEFEKLFGVSWESALANNSVLNAREAASKLGISPQELAKESERTTRGVDQLKFGGGFYVAKIQGIFVVNGFYEGMRAKFTSPGTCIHIFELEWDPAVLPWEKFRGEVIGATNPKDAADGSIRNTIFKQWKELGLVAEPNTGDNAVHASASPFEGMAEKSNWLSAAVAEDPFGKVLMQAGVSKDVISAWVQDPPVSFEGKAQSLFDLLEDLDAPACAEKAALICAGSA